ncbi:Leucine carboxyl methyltransferase [Giardia duodenalis assemblage B]|uniref:Leucine carboxyl methyltransferase 1 n=1 Tax=Giardia duodenalis assemblage B TaxID=1394984 RepID=A0A132NTC8_GIAIN|nr:Leucine carboxyl methyltransferase [Giardia intestinalis assemblage B]
MVLDRASDIVTAATTSNDALLSKLSALRAGYLVDPALRAIHTKPSLPRKDPMINRGTWFRFTYIEQMAVAFAAKYNGNCAIVNIGAGLDTLYWRLQLTAQQEKKEGKQSYFHVKHWIEIDLPSITELKAKKFDLTHGEIINMPVSEDTTIRPFQDPQVILYRPKQEHTETVPEALRVELPGYRLYAANLEMRKTWMPMVRDIVANDKGDATLPVLFLSEVCLSYLDADTTIGIIKDLPTYFNSFGIVCFEMVNPSDSFGEMMQINMAERQVVMPSFVELGFTAQYRKIFQLNGYEDSYAREAGDVYRSFWPARRREIEQLELFDEFEQWNLIMGHYACIMGWSGVTNLEEMLNSIGQDTESPDAPDK